MEDSGEAGYGPRSPVWLAQDLQATDSEPQAVSHTIKILSAHASEETTYESEEVLVQAWEM
jgi:hypothetical protein